MDNISDVVDKMYWKDDDIFFEPETHETQQTCDPEGQQWTLNFEFGFDNWWSWYQLNICAFALQREPKHKKQTRVNVNSVSWSPPPQKKKKKKKQDKSYF